MCVLLEGRKEVFNETLSCCYPSLFFRIYCLVEKRLGYFIVAIFIRLRVRREANKAIGVRLVGLEFGM